MPLVIAAVMPHGFPLVPAISDDADGALATREAMFEVSRRFKAARPDVVVIAGPHNIWVRDAIMLAACGRGAGTMHYQGRTVEMNIPFDLALRDAIAARARERGVPVADVGYAVPDPLSAVLPLDWGLMTPLWFAGHDHDQTGSGHVLADFFGPVPETSGPAAVVVNPSRSLPREVNVAFGRAVADAAEADGRRVAFIASCDWSHTHSAQGPGGFHPDAARMDAQVLQAIRDDDIMSLIDLDATFVTNASIDGLWQLLMLEGAKQVVTMTVDVLSYEAPTYYGMIVATYQRV